MQNRYVGDVGDFGKYGLLRALTGFAPAAEPRLSLGIVWYLFSREEANNDGKHDIYLSLKEGLPASRRELNNRRYRCCDPDLYDGLKHLRQNQTLHVKHIETLGLFHPSTVFVEEPLMFAGMPPIGRNAQECRIQRRKAWLQRALDKTANCELVFVDPDNGLEIPSTKRYHLDGPKFVFYDELREFCQRGQSLVIYHHLGMSGGDHAAQIRHRMIQLQEELTPVQGVAALRYRRGTGRVFFIVPAKETHGILLNQRAQILAGGPWHTHEHFFLSAPGRHGEFQD